MPFPRCVCTCNSESTSPYPDDHEDYCAVSRAWLYLEEVHEEDRHGDR